MVTEHLPSCPVSRKWRGEKASHTVYPDAKTDEHLLEKFGFVKRANSYWSEHLTQGQYEALKAQLKCQSITVDCICFNPTLSSKGNKEWNRIQTRQELAQGWGPGYRKLDLEQVEESSQLGWGKQLLALLGLGEKMKEPDSDSTLDPNWQPEYY